MEFCRSVTRKVISLVIILLLTFLLNRNQLFNTSQSQIEYFPGDLGLAGLIPFHGGENLSLEESNIEMRTEFKKDDFLMNFTFDCRYSIYNPSDTVNVTLVLPLSDDLFYHITSNSSVVNGTAVVLERVNSVLENEIEDILEEHIDSYFYYEYACIKNLELQENSTSVIQILIMSSIYISLGRSSKLLHAFYDFETMSVWNNYSDKSVEFRIDGSQPQLFTNYSDTTPEKKCLVTNYETGSSYLWQWENEQIIEERVYVEWLIPRDKPFTFLVDWDFYSILLLILSSSLIVFINKNRRKRYLHE